MRSVCTRQIALLCAALLGLAGCGGDAPATKSPLDAIALDYVQVVLGLGELDPGYVDAYYGPEAHRETAVAAGRSLPEVLAAAEALRERLRALPLPDAPLSAMRYRYLDTQLGAVAARASMVAGRSYSFDAETRALYDAVSPQHDAEHFQRILDEIDALLPGDAPLATRVSDYRERFVIPKDKLDAVFTAAIEECRRRTLEYLELPANERFTVEYVTDKPWSGYNWYQGDSFSVIQLNTDLPIYIERAVDLGCHEGYPGHHTYNALLEQHLVAQRGWLEFSVYPLFSPQSLIAEGSANFGIELAFPGEERLEFERNVLFPLAGLSPDEAARYDAMNTLLKRLSYADNEAARGYLDGRLDRAATQDWLVNYGLRTPERADQRIDFIDKYRGYVINYNLGKDLVAVWVDKEAGNDAQERWQAFEMLLSSPRLPSDLR